MNKASLVMALLVLLAACSSQPIEPSYYLLRPSEGLDSRQLVPSKQFALGRITIAPYLDQPGMLLETASGEIRPARNNLWAEPMFEGIHTFLAQEISRAKGEDILPAKINKTATTVEVRIDQLHGTANGQAKLVAFWWLRHNGEILAAYRFSESRALQQSGYGALAAAEQALLSELAVRIAKSMVNSA